MKLRWREATFEEETEYPCVDYGRHWVGNVRNFVLEQLCDDGQWRLVEIEYNPRAIPAVRASATQS